MAEAETNEIIVERMLMKFDSIPDRDKYKLNVFLIDIENMGAWVVKFRKSGVIVNNRDLIMNVNVDATITFKTVNSFFRIMDGGTTISDEIGKGKLSMSGPTEALESFHSKWLRICDLPNTSNADVPVRAPRLPSVDVKPGKVLPLKAGWLLKKRDIFSGWRCRYFVVYPDRLEYFVDQYDATPKATMSLVDVEVQPVKRVNMPGTGEHWGIIVTTKNPKSTFRLASELTGMEGNVECATWEKVFHIARNSCEQYLDSIVTDSEVAKFRRQEDVRSTVEALAKTSTGVKASPKSGTKGDGAERKPGWFDYATSKQGAPRLLLALGLTVLLVRIAWNVTKIRQMLRTMVFHGLVAVVLVLILFFLKNIFSEYFGSDDGAAVDTTKNFSTIIPSRRSPGKGASKSTAPGASTTGAGASATISAGSSASSSGTALSGAASSAGASSPMPMPTQYASISPLPPHIIPPRGEGIRTARKSVDGEH